MWIKTANGSRINLNMVAAMVISAGVGGTFNVDAFYLGSSKQIGSGFLAEADAAAFIDDLILNGS